MITTIQDIFKWILISLKSIFIENKRNLIKLLISISSILIILIEGSKEIKKLNISLTVYLLHNMSRYKSLLFLLCGLIAVASMILYDYFIVRHFKLNIPLGKIFKFSWISNTFNSFLGFVGLAGASIRTMLYKKEEVPTEKAAYTSLLITPATITGLSFLALMEVINVFNIKSILIEHRLVMSALCIIALYMPMYFLLYRFKWLRDKFTPEDFELEEPRLLRLKLALASIFEWTMAGTLLWIISINFTRSVSFFEALGVITIATTAGIISLIPGGIGSFDLVCYWALQIMGSRPHEALAILIMYRLFYYVIPWIIGIGLSLTEVGDVISEKIPKDILPVKVVQKSLSSWQRIWFTNYKQILDFGVWALSILVFICGIILIFSAAIPGIAYRLDLVAKLTSFAFMRFSHRISIVIGLMLLVVSKGIKEHIRRAYFFTIGLLLTGALFTFAKGLDYEEALFLLVAAFLLWFTRKRYYRESAPIRLSTLFMFLIITSLSMGIYVALANNASLGFVKIYKHLGITEKVFVGKEAFINNAIYAFGLTWFFIGMAILLSPKRPFDKTINDDELNKLNELLNKYEGSYRTHLLFLRDKNFYWAQDEKVLIAYSKIRDKLVVLGDPIGEEALFEDAIQEFQAFADKYALNPAFYQISEKYLSMYHQNGYYFFKLGEEAVVDLTTFNLDGKKKKDLRLVKNRFEKANLKFQVIDPPFSKEIISELRNISDAWLEGRKEKGFSLGWFQEEYINRAPVAVIENEKDEIIAFATLMPKYDGKSMAIDLMRFKNDAPNGTMDTLFLQLILWCQEKGYSEFNVGMAPLSNVGVAPYAHRQEKLAKFVYKLGNYWYSFSGLRRYKEKFDPNWEPKYLAYPQFISLPTLVLDITLLVSKSRDKRYKK